MRTNLFTSATRLFLQTFDKIKGIPSISVNSILVDQGPSVLFGSGTVSIATSLTIQGQRPPSLGGGSSLVDLFGTNLNATSVQVGDSSNRGTFLGHGTVEGSLTNNGDLSLNVSLTVTGNYTQATGGELLEYFGVGEVLNVNGERHTVRLLAPVHR